MEEKSIPGALSSTSTDLATQGQAFSLPSWDSCWVGLEGDVGRVYAEG